VFGHDPDDDHIIAAALAARGNLIGSGDRKHLRPLGTHAVTAS
jgi:predicted nucleic acid-binding protein